MRIKSFKQILHSEPFAADVLDLAFVLFIHGFRDQPYQTGRLPGEFLQVDFHRIVRTVHGLSVMDEVAHFHIQQQRLVGILDVECIKLPSSVITLMFVSLRKCFRVAFTRITFSAPSALPAIRLGGTQVHISHGRGEKICTVLSYVISRPCGESFG